MQCDNGRWYGLMFVEVWSLGVRRQIFALFDILRHAKSGSPAVFDYFPIFKPLVSQISLKTSLFLENLFRNSAPFKII